MVAGVLLLRWVYIVDPVCCYLNSNTDENIPTCADDLFNPSPSYNDTSTVNQPENSMPTAKN